MNALIERAVAELGGVDIAVSCVGIRPHQQIAEITLQDWQKVMNTNLGSAFILTQAVLPHMRRRKYGRLLYMAGTDALFPLANRAHVVAAKHGMHGLAKAVALECGPDGVTANSIAPGWLDTDRNAAWYPDLEKTYEHVRATVPLRTLGTAEDVANACLYLASDMGKFVTGRTSTAASSWCRTAIGKGARRREGILAHRRNRDFGPGSAGRICPALEADRRKISGTHQHDETAAAARRGA
ncbi:MAG: SDR family oxidoreductase [Mesorhizobium sp.]|nr:MAG: SDR family oxidoreductase [Mesorhizobium sp.]